MQSNCKTCQQTPNKTEKCERSMEQNPQCRPCPRWKVFTSTIFNSFQGSFFFFLVNFVHSTWPFLLFHFSVFLISRILFFVSEGCILSVYKTCYQHFLVLFVSWLSDFLLEILEMIPQHEFIKKILPLFKNISPLHF